MLMRLTVFLAAAWLALVALAGPVHASEADDAFVQIANNYIAAMLKMEPESATVIGEHRYDDRLTDRSATGIAKRTAYCRSVIKKLDAINASALSKTNAIDFAILRHNLERIIFENEELREWEWNPLYYNMGNAIYSLLVRDFAPLGDRLQSVRARLLRVPDVVAEAKANLKNPPKIHTETAILQNKGNIQLIRNTVTEFVRRSGADDDELRAVQEVAAGALEDYGRWLTSELLPVAHGDFRLGDLLWRKKLRFTLDSDLSREEILSRALADLKATQETMYETALPLYRKMRPHGHPETMDHDAVCRAVLDHIAEDAPDNTTIVDQARKTLTEAVAFTREHNLVTVPDKPVKLIVMPEFQRGVAVAYCDAPGPLDGKLSTFYAISPTPSDWSADRVKSFFREYNNYMIYDLTVHEAMPGHYLQLAHSNEFKAPTMVRAIYSSGSFVEGWAVYAERMMAEAGFGGPEEHMEQLKMRLRVIINAILDQKIHTGGMTEADAMALMRKEGYQEEGEVAGKWRRACLTSTQLSTYFVGSAEVEDLVASYRRVHGAHASIRKMHDKILSYGSPAPKYIRRLMNLDVSSR